MSKNKELSLKFLRTALADEFLATYQYWVCLNSSNGEGRTDANEEFDLHYKEEFEHANKVMQRIRELGGGPISDPKDLEKYSNPWTAIKTQDVSEQLKITIKAEQDAIDFYKEAIEKLKEIDITTCKVFKEILVEEEEHRLDLDDLYNELHPKSNNKNIFLS